MIYLTHIQFQANRRVIDGSDAGFGTFPWQVLLIFQQPFIFQLVYHNFTSGPKQNICLHFQNVTITIAGPGENWQGKVWWRPGQQVIGEK